MILKVKYILMVVLTVISLIILGQLHSDDGLVIRFMVYIICIIGINASWLIKEKIKETNGSVIVN